MDTHLDPGVGPDDVVQRMDLGPRRTDSKIDDGRGGERAESVTHDSTYSVTFADLGAQITIAAAPQRRGGRRVTTTPAGRGG